MVDKRSKKRVGDRVSVAFLQKEIARDLMTIERDYARREITPHTYRTLMREKVSDRTRAEWKQLLERRQRIEHRKQVQQLIPVMLALVALSLFAFFTPFIGFVTITEQIDYHQEVGKRFIGNTTFSLNLTQPGLLTGLRVEGSLSSGGSARLFATVGNVSYLVYDSSKSGLVDITGFVVAEANTSEEHATISNVSAADTAVGETSEDALLSMELISPEDTTAHSDEYLAYSVVTADAVNEEYLCSVWSVNDRQVACQGNVACCAFMGLGAVGVWDASFYLAADRFVVQDTNTVSARLIHYYFDFEGAVSDIRYSGVETSSAHFVERRISVEDSCLEACLLAEVSADQIFFTVEVNSGSFDLDTIHYSLLHSVNVSRYPPVLAQPFTNITLYQNGSHTLNLADYFADEDKDDLNYTYVLEGELNVYLEDGVLTLEAEDFFLGTAALYVTATDGHYSATSNVLWVEVVEQPATPDEVNVTVVTQKPVVRLNEPVKWVTVVNASKSTINLSVNITSDVLNVTVVNLANHRSLEEVQVRDAGKVKNLSVFKAEKRIGHIEKIADGLTLEKLAIVRDSPTEVRSIGEINQELLALQNEKNQLTGYVIAAEYGDGLLPRFFAWLRNAAITGFTVAESEESGIAELVISEIATAVAVEYYTEGPTSVERMLSNTSKQVVISSEVHYEDILAYSSLPREVEAKNIALDWMVNGTRISVPFNARDTNANGLIDFIEWVVPHLSNQTYEISLTILNIQSYPAIGGEWTIRFETTGVANLTIFAVNGTRYREMSDDNPFTADDLSLRALTCGNDVLFDVNLNLSPSNGYLVLDNGSLITLNDSFGEVYAVTGYTFLNYSCNETGRHSVHVITGGAHYQNISFGNITLMAQNDASGIACQLGTSYGFGHGCFENASWTPEPNNTTDTCIDNNADNDISTADICHNQTECIDHIGASCDYYNDDASSRTEGICSRDSATTASCLANPVSGEYGSNLTGGTAIDFHSGNENATCSDGSEGMVCQGSSGGFKPNGTGICEGSSCRSSASVYLSCDKTACAVSDMTTAKLGTTCGSAQAGFACDSSTNGSGFIQDGMCDASSCQTSGYLCNETGSGVIYANSCGNSCNEGNPCDATFTDGNFNGSYGTCAGSSCVAVGSNTAPTIGNLVLNNSNIISSDDVNASVVYNDSDNDNGTLHFIWYLNGTAIYNETIHQVRNGSNVTSFLSSTNLTKNKGINVSVYANDSTSNSSTLNSLTIPVGNGAPSIAAPVFNSSNVTSNSNITANTTYTDPDGDSGNVSLSFQVGGVDRAIITVLNVSSGSTVWVNFSDTGYSKGEVLVLFANATDATDNSAIIKGENVTVLNTPAQLSGVVFNNTSPSIIDTLQATTNYTDHDLDSGNVTAYWRVNNSIVTSTVFLSVGSGTSLSAKLSLAAYKKNDKVNITFVANDSQENTTIHSSALTVANGIPNVENVKLSFPGTSSTTTISVNATYSDPDGDNGSLLFTWYRNGTAIFNQTIVNLSNGSIGIVNLTPGNYSRDDTINVSVIGNDTVNISIASWSATTTVGNGAPIVTIPVFNDTSVSATEDLGFNTTVTDYDGDVVNVTFNVFVNNVIVGGANVTYVSSGNAARGNATSTNHVRADNLSVQAYATDAYGGTSAIVRSINITVVNSPPQAGNVSINDTNITTVNNVNVSANYSDADGDIGNITFRWYVNGTQRQNETISGLSEGLFARSSSFNATHFFRGDLVNVSATADDGFDNGTPVFTQTFTIQNAPPFLNNSLSLSIGENVAKSVTLLQHFADPEGDPLSFNTSGNSSSTVSVVINQSSSVATFTPATDYTGSSTITVGVNDSQDYSSFDIQTTVAASVSCGDGFCGASEATSCAADCDWCGDNVCNGAETCSSCAADCGNCPVSLSVAAAPAPAAAVAAPAAAAAAVSLASPKAAYGLALSASTLPCRKVSGGKEEDISIHQAVVEEGDVPANFEIILDPFQMRCSGQEIDFTVSIPEYYVNLTMLKCRGRECSPTVLNQTSRLECFDRETGKLKRENNNASVGDINASGNVSVAGGSVVQSNGTIAQAKNEFLKIIGSPLNLQVDAVDGRATTLTLEYFENQTQNIDVDGLQIFARVDDEWDPLGGTVDKNAHTVSITIEDIDSYLDEERIGLFAILGTICEFCLNSSFEKVYEGDSRNAVLLVHGFTSSPDTFEDIIADIELTEQPFQTWTFGYSSTRPLLEITQDLMDSIELNADAFDNLFIAAHSLGGIVTQKTLADAFAENLKTKKYTFIPKVKKVVLVGVPNEGAAFLDDYLKVYKFLVNRVSRYNNLFNVNSQLIDVLKEGVISPRLPGVDYFVIAGTNTQQFGNLLEIEATGEAHDGLVTVKSAQRIGDDYVDNRCTNYWDINVTHTGLIEKEVSRKLIEKIIASEIIASGVETAVGNTNYYDLHIDTCSSRDRYILVGQRISDDAAFDATGCKCGNGVCGQGEDELNCPSDCFKGFSFKSIPWRMVSQGIGFLILLGMLYKGTLLFIILRSRKFARFTKAHRLLKKHLRKKRIEAARAVYRSLQQHYRTLEKSKSPFLVKRQLWRMLRKHRKSLRHFDEPLVKIKMLRRMFKRHLRNGHVAAARKVHLRMHRLYVDHFFEVLPKTHWKKPLHTVKLMWRNVRHPLLHLRHHLARAHVSFHVWKIKKR